MTGNNVCIIDVFPVKSLNRSSETSNTALYDCYKKDIITIPALVLPLRLEARCRKNWKVLLPAGCCDFVLRECVLFKV